MPAVNDPPPVTLSYLEVILKNFLNIAITLGGIAAFIMIIIGGFKYMTSGGDPKQTQAASQTITYAIIGLLAAIGSWFILKFIAGFTGIDLFNFSITDTPASSTP